MSEILGPNGCPMVERAPRRQVTAERSREKLIRHLIPHGAAIGL